MMNDNLKMLDEFKRYVNANVGDPKEKHNYEFIGLCPFHNETNPSFTGNFEKGVYHCKSCGEKGHAYDFLQHFGCDMSKFKNGQINPGVVNQLQAQKHTNPPKKKLTNKPLKEPKNTIIKNNDIITKLPKNSSYNWTEEVIKALEIGYQSYKGNLVFPIHNSNGQWVNVWLHKPEETFIYKGLKCQLYPLHLIKGYVKDKPTFVAEGMKDVATLLSYNLQAISGTNGLGIPSDLSPLNHLNRFIVLNDNDDSGIILQEKWCSSLYSNNRNISYTDWNLIISKQPHKSDVTDISYDVFSQLWDSSLTYQLNQQKGQSDMSMFQFIEQNNKPVEYIVDNLLTKKGVLIIGATDGVGKSIMASQLAFCIATGKPFLGDAFKVKPKPVHLMNFELSDEELASRAVLQQNSSLFQTIPKKDYKPLIVSVKKDTEIFSDKWDFLNHKIKNNPQLHGGVLIVDNLYTSTNRNLSENHELSRVLARIEDIKTKYDMSIILIAHFNKIQKGDILETRHITGGKALTNYADNILLLGESNFIPELRIGKITKIRSGKSEIKGLPFKLKLDDEELMFRIDGMIKNEEAHFNGNGASQELDVLLSMKTHMPKWLNTDKYMFTSNDYGNAMNEFLDYKPSKATKHNWINRLVKLQVIKKLGHNQYQPLWETIEDES